MFFYLLIDSRSMWYIRYVPLINPQDKSLFFSSNGNPFIQSFKALWGCEFPNIHLYLNINLNYHVSQ